MSYLASLNKLTSSCFSPLNVQTSKQPRPPRAEINIKRAVRLITALYLRSLSFTKWAETRNILHSGVWGRSRLPLFNAATRRKKSSADWSRRVEPSHPTSWPRADQLMNEKNNRKGLIKTNGTFLCYRLFNLGPDVILWTLVEKLVIMGIEVT